MSNKRTKSFKLCSVAFRVARKNILGQRKANYIKYFFHIDTLSWDEHIFVRSVKR